FSAPSRSITSTTLPRWTPSTITLTLPLGSFRFWITAAITPSSKTSSRSGSSIFGSFWATRKIRFCAVPRLCSSARTELSRPTMNGAIMWGKTTMSRRGTSGRISRFLSMKDAAIGPPFRGLSPVPGLARLLVEHDRLNSTGDDFLVDHALFDVPLRWDRIHQVEHQVFEDDPQASGSDVSREGLAGDRDDRLVGELELHALELEHRLVLLDQAVLRLLEDAHQRLLVELLQGRHHRQAADELGDQAVADQVFGQHLLQDLALRALLLAPDVGAEAERLLVQPTLDHVVQTDEGAAADEQDVGGIDLEEFLVRVLPAPLRRHVALRSFEDLEQRLLHALARDVAGDRGVVALPTDLVHFVDVDDAALGLLFVAAGGLVELEDDVFDVLADVARLGEGRRVGDRERHGEEPRKGLREQRLARPGRADQHDVRLRQLDFAVRRLFREVDPLVVVVDRDRELLLRGLLADHVLVEERLDLLRLRQRGVLLLFEHPVFRDDVDADIDAFVADENRRAGDELFDLTLALIAERAPQDLVAALFLRHFFSSAAGAKIRDDEVMLGAIPGPVNSYEPRRRPRNLPGTTPLFAGAISRPFRLYVRRLTITRS